MARSKRTMAVQVIRRCRGEDGELLTVGQVFPDMDFGLANLLRSQGKVAEVDPADLEDLATDDDPPAKGKAKAAKGKAKAPADPPDNPSEVK